MIAIQTYANATTRISKTDFQVPENSKMMIEVYNLLGGSNSTNYEAFVYEIKQF